MGDSGDEKDINELHKEIDFDDKYKKLDLPDVPVSTGEENEDLIFKSRAKLFRWRNNEWKERGIGDIKLLRNKDSKKVRFILRQDQTLKVVANFVVSSSGILCKLENHQGSEKVFFFTAYDNSDDKPDFEKFIIKLGNAELAGKFKEAFENAREFNKLVEEGKENEAKWAEVISTKDEEKKDETKEDKKD